MGLLDEAIRDHLELKRRRGADPGLVAREEREALAPALAEDAAAVAAPVTAGDAADPAALVTAETSSPLPHPVPAQETAELDMQAEIGAGPHGEGVDGPAAPIGEENGERDTRPAPADWGLEPATRAGDGPAVGSFDLGEIPDEEPGGSGLPEEIPGQERLSLE